MGQQLSKCIKGTMVLAPLAASSSNGNSASVDMANYEGAMFVLNVGTAGAGAIAGFYAEGGASTTGFAALAGSTALASTGGADDGFLYIDVFRPRHRYLRTGFTRSTTTDIELGGVMCYQYGPRTLPTTWSSTEAVSDGVSLVSPSSTA